MINTKKHLAFILNVSASEIDILIKNMDDLYYEKREVKYDKEGNPKIKRGVVQERVLHPSKGDLKVLQKKIQRIILRKLPLPDYAYGGIRGKDNISNAKKHQGKKYIFTTDLRDFYPSISHKRVFQMFRSFGFSPTVSRILTQLTTYKGRLPQGTPTSPLIANLVFVKTGVKLNEFAKKNGITFTSFVDDLTFSAPVDFKDKAHLIIEQLILDGFRISHNKTNYKTKFPMVTGIVVKNNSLDISDTFKDKLANLSDRTEAQIKGLKLYAERVKNGGGAKIPRNR